MRHWRMRRRTPGHGWPGRAIRRPLSNAMDGDGTYRNRLRGPPPRFLCSQRNRASRTKLSPCGTPSGPKRRSAKTIASAPTRTMVLQRVP